MAWSKRRPDRTRFRGAGAAWLAPARMSIAQDRLRRQVNSAFMVSRFLATKAGALMGSHPGRGCLATSGRRAEHIPPAIPASFLIHPYCREALLLWQLYFAHLPSNTSNLPSQNRLINIYFASFFCFSAALSMLAPNGHVRDTLAEGERERLILIHARRQGACAERDRGLDESTLRYRERLIDSNLDSLCCLIVHLV
jgi:hypothetical protein